MIFSRGDNSFSAMLSVIRRDTGTLNSNLNNSISGVHSKAQGMSFAAPQTMFGQTVLYSAQGYPRNYTRRS